MEDDELVNILSGGQKAIGAMPTVSNEPQEMELTPELKNRYAVVNEARTPNRASGVANFLSNPETQNALLQFARAFSKNDPNSAGTILAEGGEKILGAQANNRALQAAESGGDIAQAGGTFADASLVSQLQQARSTDEQAAAQIAQGVQRLDIERDRLGLSREQVENDFLLSKAIATNNEEEVTQRLQLLSEKQDIDSKLATAEIDFYRARIDALNNPKEDNQNILLRTNEYLDLLNEQETNLSIEIQNLKDEVKDAEDKVGWWGEFFELESTTKAQEAALEEAKTELSQAETSLQAIKQQKQSIQETQSGRLGGNAVYEADNFSDAVSRPAGSTVSLMGATYEVNEDGTLTPKE